MHVIREITAVAMPLASRQEPLLTVDQLEPGIFLTGIAMTHLWHLVEIDHGAGILTIGKMPSYIRCSSHTFIPQGHGTVCTACNLRKQPISDFLPTKLRKARVHVISIAVNQCIITPKVGVIYAYFNRAGNLGMLTYNGTKWSAAVPIVPLLHKVWDVPTQLQKFIVPHVGEAENSVEPAE